MIIVVISVKMIDYHGFSKLLDRESSPRTLRDGSESPGVGNPTGLHLNNNQPTNDQPTNDQTTNSQPNNNQPTSDHPSLTNDQPNNNQPTNDQTNLFNKNPTDPSSTSPHLKQDAKVVESLKICRVGGRPVSPLASPRTVNMSGGAPTGGIESQSRHLDFAR